MYVPVRRCGLRLAPLKKISSSTSGVIPLKYFSLNGTFSSYALEVCLSFNVDRGIENYISVVYRSTFKFLP